MKIWNGIENLPELDSAVVASIGNYDGVHLGHRAILRAVIEEARRTESPAFLITFDPHPLVVVAPERRPQLLQTRRQKLAALEQTGLTDLLVLEFGPALAELSGESFFQELLAPHLRFTTIHVGENFRFGNRRSGNLELLRRIGAGVGFAVNGVPPVQVEGETVSSSAIRAAVLEGDVERAWRMLGLPFALGGDVARGDGRGREIGFPTANLAVENEILPAAGVYVTEVVALAGRFPAMTNVGVRPTFTGRHVTVESHLLDFSGDLYRERVEVRFLARIREETRFSSAAELSDQIARDRAAAEAYFHNVQLGSP